MIGLVVARRVGGDVEDAQPGFAAARSAAGFLTETKICRVTEKK